MKSKNFVSAAVLVLIVSSTLGSTPAFATQTRTLPTGESYFAVECADSVGKIATVDVSTGIGTIVGSNSPTPNTGCAYSSAWDVTINSYYWVSGIYNEGTGMVDLHLMLANLTTGASTDVFALQNGALAIAINDLGQMYAIGDGNNLYSVDLGTGAMTLIASVANLGASNSCIRAFAFNPADQNFYINCAYGSPVVQEIRSLDVTNGSTALACDLGIGTGLRGIGFDSAGIGWMGARMDTTFGVASFDVTQSGCGLETGSPMTVTGNVTWGSDAIAISYAAPDPGPDPEPNPGPDPDSAPADAVLPNTGLTTDALLGTTALSLVMFSLASAFIALHRLRARRP